MHLVELESTNVEGSDRVSVAAALRADKRNDAVLGRVVDRLSLEPAATGKPGECQVESWVLFATCGDFVIEAHSHAHDRLRAQLRSSENLPSP